MLDVQIANNRLKVNLRFMNIIIIILWTVYTSTYVLFIRSIFIDKYKHKYYMYPYIHIVLYAGVHNFHIIVHTYKHTSKHTQMFTLNIRLG